MNKLICAIFFILEISPTWSYAQPSLEGAWQLTYVAPTDINNASPMGITNTKLLFRANGTLISLKPEETTTSATQEVNYSFDGNEITIFNPNGNPMKLGVTFTDNETMLINPQYQSQRTFKRISSIDIPLEPKSLELIDSPAFPITQINYDLADYSKKPNQERMNGIWEVVGYRGVPREQVPPYGFFNDIWTITSKTVTVNRREPPAIDTVDINFADNHITSSGISLGNSEGSKITWEIDYNKWGNLVLTSEYCQVILKLISKNTAVTPILPLKVVTLSTTK